jgi:hypothetical protein
VIAIGDPTIFTGMKVSPDRNPAVLVFKRSECVLADLRNVEVKSIRFPGTESD